MELYLDSFFELPVTHNGKLYNYQEVVMEINRQFISNSNSIGFRGGRFEPGSHSQLLTFDFKLQV